MDDPNSEPYCKLRDQVAAYSTMADQLPDPDQHPHDLQCEYRSWLIDLDKALAALQQGNPEEKDDV